MPLLKKIMKIERNHFNDAHHLRQSLRAPRAPSAPCYVRWAPRGLHTQQWDDVASAVARIDRAICVITGSTGVGKTIVALMIALTIRKMCFIVSPCMTSLEIRLVMEAIRRDDVLIVDNYDADPHWGARMCDKHGRVVVTQTLPKFSSPRRAYTMCTLRPLPVEFVQTTLLPYSGPQTTPQSIRNLYDSVRGDFRRICLLVEERGSKRPVANQRRGTRTVEELAAAAVDPRKRLNARIDYMTPEVGKYSMRNLFPRSLPDAIRWTEAVSAVDLGVPPQLLCMLGSPLARVPVNRKTPVFLQDYRGELRGTALVVEKSPHKHRQD
jgi:hypothetical protein